VFCASAGVLSKAQRGWIMQMMKFSWSRIGNSTSHWGANGSFHQPGSEFFKSFGDSNGKCLKQHGKSMYAFNSYESS
jgi:hypothetical protein